MQIEPGGKAEVVESSEADDDGESSESSEPTPNILQRKSRSTQGKSWTVLDGKQLEDDQEFWNHADFQDASSDSDFNVEDEESEAKVDSSDSDFSKHEEAEEPAEAAEEEEKERSAVRQTLPAAKSYFAKSLPKHRLQAAASVRKRPRPKVLSPQRTIRQSTLRKRAERRVQEAKAAAEAEVAVPREPRPQRRQLTQQERLEEAVKTEEMNVKEFRAMRSYEEEERRRTRRGHQRLCPQGPRVRLVSRLCDGAEGLLGGWPGVESFLELVECDFAQLLQGGGGPSQGTAPKRLPARSEGDSSSGRGEIGRAHV
eukprot:TRINITY_DN56298_c0_g1_i1.p1 TRINITY_DN56298_c0_g1~~TRINITY_DN56298_c0_g1_i1.p1  ORF type:complete len:313 (+),score=84.38 TRINITY_DN56298_c0_g1_i1:74-1012(+)